MSSSFMIVHKKILPDYYEKVIEARTMLESREVSTVTEAVSKVGISRNTYYKYKDYVFPYEGGRSVRRAVVSIILKDKNGSLSAVLNCLSDFGISILTISQAVPVSGKANVLLSLDISGLKTTIDEVIRSLKTLEAVKNAHLDAME